MMKCPKCRAPLQRQTYEGLSIHGCTVCLGHLLKKQRLSAIKARRERKLHDFQEEIQQAAKVPAAADSTSTIRCPKCRSSMEKRRKPFGPSHFQIDRCNKCQLIWLDGGELAKLQIAFEYSAQGMERAQVRERLENMNEQEKAEFQARIDNLPESSFVSELMTSYLTEGWGNRWDSYYDSSDLLGADFFGSSD